MQNRAHSARKDPYYVDVEESVRRVAVDRLALVRERKRRIVRFLLLAAAFLAVALLVAIAVYYTQGNAVTIKQV